MRCFVLNRIEDESGVSGTGIVAEGVQFSNGKCVVSWLTQVHSTAVYDSIEDVKQIHGHKGKTEVVMESELIALSREVVFKTITMDWEGM